MRKSTPKSPTIVLITALMWLILLASTAEAAGQGLLFTETWGGVDLEEGSSITRDAGGSLYVAGYTRSFVVDGQVCVGGKCADALLLKYDSTGGLVWSKTWGESGKEIAEAVIVDPFGNVYLTGETSVTDIASPDIFLLKLNSEGNLVWARTVGGNESELVRGLALDAQGNVYLSGLTNSFGAGGDDVFMAKFDSNGNALWEYTWGGSEDDRGSELTIDLAGNVYLTGSTVSFSVGGVCGFEPLRGCDDAFLLKLNSTGALLWQIMWGGGDGDGATGVVTDSALNVYMTGAMSSFRSTGEVFVLRLDSNGSLLWEHTYGGAQSDVGRGVAIHSSGDIFIVGHDENSGGSFGVLLLKLDSLGRILTQATWGGDGGTGYDEGRGIAVDSNGNAFVTGYVFESGPYSLHPANLQIGTPTAVLRQVGNETLGVPNFPVSNASMTLGSPQGSQSYAGSRELFLIGVGSLPAPTFGPWSAVLLTGILTSIAIIARKTRIIRNNRM